jgi:signal peptidase II
VNRKYLWLLALCVPVLLLDQWTKFLVLRELTVAFQDAPTLPEQLDVFLSNAPSATEGFLHYKQKKAVTVFDFPANLRGPLFHVVSLGAVFLLGFFFRELTGKNPKEKWALWGLPLVFAGAMGNYADRLARGFVIDFLEFHWHDRVAWPSFNVADIAICVGVGMLFIDSFVRPKPPKEASP